MTTARWCRPPYPPRLPTPLLSSLHNGSGRRRRRRQRAWRLVGCRRRRQARRLVGKRRRRLRATAGTGRRATPLAPQRGSNAVPSLTRPLFRPRTGGLIWTQEPHFGGSYVSSIFADVGWQGRMSSQYTGKALLFRPFGENIQKFHVSLHSE